VKAPAGTKVDAEGGGLFKETQVRRQTQMEPAQEGPSVDDLGVPNGLVEHVAGIEDYQLALTTFRAACERWPNTPISSARVIEDSRRLPLG
jgi:hypothetical protein